jgi:hypothetical protein
VEHDRHDVAISDRSHRHHYGGLIVPRRFPPPWSVEETDACFIVRDHGGQALAYVYFEEEPGVERAQAPHSDVVYATPS